ncbi:hypothetical protein [Microbacterium ulmi]|nr:hypothetical protein [Microbacterium ulmi]NII69885.1 hypothetical protein [Microbacterium ulmi]
MPDTTCHMSMSVLLGTGERIFDGFESLGLEPVEVLHSPLATHIRYRRTS